MLKSLLALGSLTLAFLLLPIGTISPVTTFTTAPGLFSLNSSGGLPAALAAQTGQGEDDDCDDDDGPDDGTDEGPDDGTDDDDDCDDEGPETGQ